MVYDHEDAIGCAVHFLTISDLLSFTNAIFCNNDHLLKNYIMNAP